MRKPIGLALLLLGVGAILTAVTLELQRNKKDEEYAKEIHERYEESEWSSLVSRSAGLSNGPDIALHIQKIEVFMQAHPGVGPWTNEGPDLLNRLKAKQKAWEAQQKEDEERKALKLAFQNLIIAANRAKTLETCELILAEMRDSVDSHKGILGSSWQSSAQREMRLLQERIHSIRKRNSESADFRERLRLLTVAVADASSDAARIDAWKELLKWLEEPIVRHLRDEQAAAKMSADRMVDAFLQELMNAEQLEDAVRLVQAILSDPRSKLVVKWALKIALGQVVDSALAETIKLIGKLIEDDNYSLIREDLRVLASRLQGESEVREENRAALTFEEVETSINDARNKLIDDVAGPARITAFLTDSITQIKEYCNKYPQGRHYATADNWRKALQANLNLKTDSKVLLAKDPGDLWDKKIAMSMRRAYTILKLDGQRYVFVEDPNKPYEESAAKWLKVAQEDGAKRNVECIELLRHYAYRLEAAQRVENDDFEAAKLLITKAEIKYPRDVYLSILGEIAMREAVPLWVKNAVKEADSYFQQGEYKMAIERYNDALNAANVHYKKLIDAGLREAWPKYLELLREQTDEALRRGDGESAFKLAVDARKKLPESAYLEEVIKILSGRFLPIFIQKASDAQTSQDGGNLKSLLELIDAMPSGVVDEERKPSVDELREGLRRLEVQSK